MTTADKPLALTMGEPAGIAGELSLKAWLQRREKALPVFFAIDDPQHLTQLAERLGWSVPVVEIDTPEPIRYVLFQGFLIIDIKTNHVVMRGFHSDGKACIDPEIRFLDHIDASGKE